jgi:hypothetical protein
MQDKACSLETWHEQLHKESVMAILTHSPIKTQVRRIDGLSIRYAESDARDVSAILLSPWPESLFTFEQMWSRLAEHAHLVAIDLPGFGHSERRNDLLTSSAMGEFVAHVVEEFGLRRPHAVGPISELRPCCSPPPSIQAFCGASLSGTAPPLCLFRSALC